MAPNQSFMNSIHELFISNHDKPSTTIMTCFDVGVYTLKKKSSTPVTVSLRVRWSGGAVQRLCTEWNKGPLPAGWRASPVLVGDWVWFLKGCYPVWTSLSSSLCHWLSLLTIMAHEQLSIELAYWPSTTAGSSFLLNQIWFWFAPLELWFWFAPLE